MSDVDEVPPLASDEQHAALYELLVGAAADEIEVVFPEE